MTTCYQSLQACFLRVVVLDADGTPLTGPDSVYTTDAFISVQNSLQVKAGDSFNMVNACGSVCGSYDDCDRIQSTSGTTTLCALDAELIGMMTSSTILTNLEGEAIGLAVPEYNAVCPNGFSMEVWTKAWDGNQPAVDGNDRLYWRHVWPRQLGRIGDYSLENGFLQVPVALKGSANSSITELGGPSGDWPAGIGAAPYAFFLDPSTPTPICGATGYPTVS